MKRSAPNCLQKLEFKKVECAKEEMLLRIMEREEYIQRLKENIKIQDLKLEELTLDIQEMEK